MKQQLGTAFAILCLAPISLKINAQSPPLKPFFVPTAAPTHSSDKNTDPNHPAWLQYIEDLKKNAPKDVNGKPKINLDTAYTIQSLVQVAPGSADIHGDTDEALDLQNSEEPPAKAESPTPIQATAPKTPTAQSFSKTVPGQGLAPTPSVIPDNGAALGQAHILIEKSAHSSVAISPVPIPADIVPFIDYADSMVAKDKKEIQDALDKKSSPTVAQMQNALGILKPLFMGQKTQDSLRWFTGALQMRLRGIDGENGGADQILTMTTRIDPPTLEWIGKGKDRHKALVQNRPLVPFMMKWTDLHYCEEKNVYVMNSKGRATEPPPSFGRWLKHNHMKKAPEVHPDVMAQINHALNGLKNRDDQVLGLMAVTACVGAKESAGGWYKDKNQPENWGHPEVGFNNLDATNTLAAIKLWNDRIKRNHPDRPELLIPLDDASINSALAKRDQLVNFDVGLTLLFANLGCQQLNWKLKDATGQSCVSIWNDCYNHFGSLMWTSLGTTNCLHNLMTKGPDGPAFKINLLRAVRDWHMKDIYSTTDEMQLVMGPQKPGSQAH